MTCARFRRTGLRPVLRNKRPRAPRPAHVGAGAGRAVRRIQGPLGGGRRSGTSAAGARAYNDRRRLKCAAVKRFFVSSTPPACRPPSKKPSAAASSPLSPCRRGAGRDQPEATPHPQPFSRLRVQGNPRGRRERRGSFPATDRSLSCEAPTQELRRFHALGGQSSRPEVSA
jgi:hypothetical protein